MARYLNLETGLVALAAFGLLLAWAMSMGVVMPTAFGLAVVGSLFAAVGFGPFVVDKLIEVYAESGRVERALGLAQAVRDTAPTARAKNAALVDVALIHVMRGDAQAALFNLDQVRLTLMKDPAAKAVVQSHLAYALAHLDRELDRAEALAREAFGLMPDIGLFRYFVGLTLAKKGLWEAAEKEIAASLESDPDLKTPYPGERPYFLALCRTKLGRDPGPARSQAEASGGRYQELAQALGS